jgi:quinolinate synthase
MVNRLAREMGETRPTVSLDDCFCVCSTMARIDPPHLLWVLEGLVEGEVRNPVRVPDQVAHEARVALDRMLAIH